MRMAYMGGAARPGRLLGDGPEGPDDLEIARGDGDVPRHRAAPDDQGTRGGETAESVAAVVRLDGQRHLAESLRGPLTLNLIPPAPTSHYGLDFIYLRGRLRFLLGEITTLPRTMPSTACGCRSHASAIARYLFQANPGKMQLITSLLPAISLISGALAQSSLKFTPFTDDNDIEFFNAAFDSSVGSGDAQFGVVLPPADADDLSDEYIGRMVVPIPESGTWFGITHKSGMTSNLILLAWANGDEVVTDFRYATGYTSPKSYTGNATLSKISESVNDTHFELTYRCEHCWVWDLEGTDGSQIPSTNENARQIIGWGQAASAPSDPEDSGSAIEQHASANMMAFTIADARNDAYTDYTALATATEAPPSGTSGNSTEPAVPSATSVPTADCPSNGHNETYDYIIVGSGAGGIPAAAKLAESGKKVLLIERGPASSHRHGGRMIPGWLADSNLTRFDVPGLSNEIWAHSDGIACTDYSVMAGCVLGGGTAVNAGLWWNPDPLDFDQTFPEGWKYADIEPAIRRAFDKIPYNERPSADGQLYKAQGYEIVAGALEAAGWQNVSAGAQPEEKNRTYTHPNHMFANGERGGPMATYLVDAKELPNFTLMVNTTVNRVIRDGSEATGVEVEAFLPGGQCGNINLASGGKVVLSAGAFGSPKILFRSGIGPQDQLETVKKAEGDALIDESEWINLPVGENLDDHANTEIVITHPNVEFYDYYEAFQNPIPSDGEKYLEDRSGILAQAAANLGVVFWHDSVGPDGISRTSQWTARIESSHGVKSNKSISLSHYLGRGKTSRGRTTINTGLTMTVSETPYINNDDDLAATKDAISMVINALSANKDIDLVFPSKNTTLDDYLADYAQTTGSRSANHWMGSCKMGTDSGLENGTAVVDTDTKVYGMDNLFVVDASIFPEMITTNPSALIVSVAEHAVEKIMAAGGSGSSNSTTVPEVAEESDDDEPVVSESETPATTAQAESSAPAASNTTVASTASAPVEEEASSTSAAVEEPAVSSPAADDSSSAAPAPTSAAEPSSKATASATATAQDTAPKSSSAAAASPTASKDAESSSTGSSSGATVGAWQQCGGNGMESKSSCESGSVCKEWSEYYSQCVPESQA
ncbi:hypothetical protein Q7P37_000881 [Cladosporium fusiforme]